MAMKGDDDTDTSDSMIITAETAVMGRSPPFRRHKSIESLLPSSSVTTKSPFDNLSNELFEEILQRLPLKLAHLCKCVSKRWYGLIATPHFARCYVQKCSSLVPPFALFYQDFDRAVQLTSETPIFESRGFSLNFLPSSNPLPSSSDQHQPEPIRYLASSNGLVLCSATLAFQRVYYVCNPLTMHWVELPPPPTCQVHVIIGFVCKPCYSIDSTTCTTSFRVVRIHEFEPPHHPPGPPPRSANLKLDIFSSDTWRWAESILSNRGRNFIMSYNISNAVVCNGILHWMQLYHGRIFAYDPFNNTDQFRTIRVPKDSYPDPLNQLLLGECQGHIRFIQYDDPTLSIWELKDHNGLEWSLVHKVNLDRMESEDSCWIPRNAGFNYVSILPVHSIDGDIIYLHTLRRIVLCNMRSSTLKEVCSPDTTYRLDDSVAFPFVLPWWPTSVPQSQRNALKTDGRSTRTDGRSTQVSEPRINSQAQKDPVSPQQEAAAEEPTRDQLVDDQVVHEGDVRSHKFQIGEDNNTHVLSVHRSSF